MCIFQELQFHCGCTILQISRPCPQASTNAQNELFCPADLHPHLNDPPSQRRSTRIFDPKTYCPGVCAFIHCRWKYAVQPEGEFESPDEPYDQPRNSFDMADDACQGRERAYFRLLTAEQREALYVDFPYPRSAQVESMSAFAQAYLCDDEEHAKRVLADGRVLDPEEVHWTELNPRFFSPAQLSLVTGLLLPASVTIPARDMDVRVWGASPLMPVVGPFALRGEHVCWPVPGVCGVCGRNWGRGFEIGEVGGRVCVVEKGRGMGGDTVMEG
ncbi:hypothetical protein BDY17DRAFT_311219 [Neohortaea acidophila]|uniref:Uncharacterized protein n=1 Tax=Neohortaea acidophila TaxID=245834 RepID=A0A6A6PT03_9PEZI|nr:uncharacterized protein BDY17DRAFT_311219 [Neohortaea acidophila]KAF2482814.1 hypothetical protein BDY17DRAFT_311219 [Neohortaea acidophila]